MCYALDISVDPGRANTGCTWALSDVYRMMDLALFFLGLTKEYAKLRRCAAIPLSPEGDSLLATTMMELERRNLKLALALFYGA